MYTSCVMAQQIVSSWEPNVPVDVFTVYLNKLLISLTPKNLQYDEREGYRAKQRNECPLGKGIQIRDKSYPTTPLLKLDPKVRQELG